MNSFEKNINKVLNKEYNDKTQISLVNNTLVIENLAGNETLALTLEQLRSGILAEIADLLRPEDVAAILLMLQNAQNPVLRRGIAITPVKFGISFNVVHFNQAGALVHIYTDGTVLVTHGGVEMGQGLHTKVAQVAAQALGCPLASVFIAETATDKVPNSSPTAASASSDMYGAAVLDACAQLNARLAPLRERLSGGGGGGSGSTSPSTDNTHQKDTLLYWTNRISSAT